MSLIQAAKSSIKSEMNQQKVLQKNLLLKILTSRRLLVDHSEPLEGLVNDLKIIESLPKDDLTFLSTSGVLATSFVAFFHLKQNLRYLIPAIIGVVPILYVKKLVNTKKRRSVESQFAKFIDALNSYELAIKKNKALFNEAQVVKSSASILKRYDKDNKLPENVVQSVKNVINALYDFIKHLEKVQVSDLAEMIYEPVEDIQTCELMAVEKDIDKKTITDLFNVFAYIQSQALMRFSLITVSNVEECSMIVNSKLSEMTNIIESETKDISKFVDMINYASQQHSNILMQINRETAKMPKELREVRHGSILFSAKILTLAMQCQNLEEQIVRFAESYEHPVDIMIKEITEMMRDVENNLSVSIAEHQRIAIAFQKYLNIETAEAKIPQETLDSATAEKPEVKRVTEEDVMVQSDEFYFVDGSNLDSMEESQSTLPESMEEVNSKLAKKYFKPVLVQLRERIVGIGDNMKERERKVLKSKGIEIDDEPELAKIPTEFDEGDSGSDDERERKRKFRKNEEKFSDNREFLEAKQPVNFFGAGGFKLPSPAKALNEDVLE